MSSLPKPLYLLSIPDAGAADDLLIEPVEEIAVNLSLVYLANSLSNFIFLGSLRKSHKAFALFLTSLP